MLDRDLDVMEEGVTAAEPKTIDIDTLQSKLKTYRHHMKRQDKETCSGHN